MTEFSYENQGTNTYLVYEIKESEQIDSLTLGMIVNNKIPGFSNTVYTQINEKKLLKYSITSKISANEFFSGTVTKKRLLGVFKSIVKGFISAEDYMIDANSLILDAKYVYCNVSSCEAELICLPLKAPDDIKTDLKVFFKNIMFRTSFDQKENCDYIAVIINYLNSNSPFSIYEFKNVLESIDDNADKIQKKKSTIKNTTSNNVNEIKEDKIKVKKPLESRPVVQKSPTPAYPLKNEPPVVNKSVQKPVSVVEQNTNEQEISLFYLLQHYNKDNATLYKAQKKRKKHNNTESKSVPLNTQFAVPGINNNINIQKKPLNSFNSGTHSNILNRNSLNNDGIKNDIQQENIQHLNANFGETTVLSQTNDVIAETTVLVPEKRQSPYLIRIKNSERVIINKPVFNIGKEKSYVDYFIGDNAAVSRSHAKVLMRDNKFYVVDTNSTNHTYVNGKQINSNIEVEISNGDKLSFANEDFEFKLF